MIKKLLEDHDHIRKILNLLEKQFLDLCRNPTPDYSMMLSIIAYIEEYPEQAHHPRDDAMFSVFLQRGEDGSDLVRAIIRDHTELEHLTLTLRELLESVIAGGGFRKDELKRQLMTFIARQRRHFHTEEAQIYPLVHSALTESDWNNVASIVPDMADPVFGQRTRGDFDLLFRELEN